MPVCSLPALGWVPEARRSRGGPLAGPGCSPALKVTCPGPQVALALVCAAGQTGKAGQTSSYRTRAAIKSRSKSLKTAHLSPSVDRGLGVTERTIRQMIADGRLTGYRNGQRLVRLDIHEIDASLRPFGGGGVKRKPERPAPLDRPSPTTPATPLRLITTIGPSR